MLFVFLGACLSFTCCEANEPGFTYPVGVDMIAANVEIRPLVELDPDGLLLGVEVIDLHVPHAIAPQLDERGDVVCRPVEYVSALDHVAASQG